MNYFELVKPTYIENWPNALCSLSLAQVDVPLTLDEAKALGTNIMEYGETFGDAMADISDIRERVAAELVKFPKGAFIRLGSRSPKDSWLGNREGFKVRADDGKDPLRLASRITKLSMLSLASDVS